MKLFLNEFVKGQILKKDFDSMGMTFFVLLLKWDNYYRKQFFSSKWDTYSYTKLFWFFEAFMRKLTKKLNLTIKKGLPQEEAKNSREIFLREFEKRQIKKKGFDLMEMTVFVQISEIGQLLQKTVFLLKMSHIS